MNDSLATIIGAGIGAIAALCGVFLTHRRSEFARQKEHELEIHKLQHQLDLEHEKLAASHKSLLDQETRTAIQSCVAQIASATHSMCWLLWMITVDENRFTAQRVEKYDEEMHRLLPEIIGLIARIRAYDPDTAKRISKLSRKLEDLDARIGEACIEYLNAKDGWKNKLLELYGKTQEMYSKLSKLSYTIAFDSEILK